MSSTTHPGGAFELMAEGDPCPGPCEICDLFGPLTPERLARIAAQATRDARPAWMCRGCGSPERRSTAALCTRCYGRAWRARRVS